MMLLDLAAGVLLLAATVQGPGEPSCTTWTTGGGLAANITTQCTDARGVTTGHTCSVGPQLLCQTLAPLPPPPTVAEILADQQRGPPIPGRGGARWDGDDGR
jgi:hypothetical protein